MNHYVFVCCEANLFVAQVFGSFLDPHPSREVEKVEIFIIQELGHATCTH